jgi:hypothetical protein
MVPGNATEEKGQEKRETERLMPGPYENADQRGGSPGKYSGSVNDPSRAKFHFLLFGKQDVTTPF